MDELRELKTAVDAYFRLEHQLFRSSEPMTQEALDYTVKLFHEARAKALRLSGITEAES